MQQEQSDTQKFVAALNARNLPFLRVLGAEFVSLDRDAQSCAMRYDISRDLCHSEDIVQGGFVTAMLDAVSSYAVFGLHRSVISLSSLEITTRYLEPARAGNFNAVGRIVRLSYKTAFLEAELRDPQGSLVATMQSVAKVGRKAAQPDA